MFIEKSKWTYFITLTVNDTETPGVLKFTKAIAEYSESDHIAIEDLTDAYLSLILRIW